MEKPLANGLWRDNPETREGKYLVKRRDGTVVEWPNFTLGARDPCAPAALEAYAAKALSLGLDIAYAKAVANLADEFEAYRIANGEGDPDRGRHRIDDPDIIAEMRSGKGV